MVDGRWSVALILAALLAGCNANCFDPQVQPPKQQDVGGGGEELPGGDSRGPVDDLAADRSGGGGDLEPGDGGTDVQEPADITAESGGDVPVSGCTDPEALNFDPSATEDDGSCLFPVAVTFNVDMSCAKGVVAPQVAGGNTFGMPGDHPMADPDGDEVWTVTVPIASGLATAYTFTSDVCPDWSCKEKIGGQECATEPYDDRFFTMGTTDVTIDACFGVCGNGFCGQCPPGSPPPESVVQCKAPQVKVEFLLDMSQAWAVAQDNAIALQGSFAGFWPGIVMERIPATKLFRTAVCLDADTDYTFKFAGYEFSNGANEFPDNAYEVGAPPCPGTTTTAECQYGTCTDRLLHTGTKDMTAGVYLWGQCDTYPPPL
jgi:hypothetical protein